MGHTFFVGILLAAFIGLMQVNSTNKYLQNYALIMSALLPHKYKHLT